MERKKLLVVILIVVGSLLSGGDAHSVFLHDFVNNNTVTLAVTLSSVVGYTLL